MGKCDKEYYKKFEEREPTRVYKKGETTVKVYGELKLLKGKALSEFKAMVQDELSFKGINSLQLLSRRGLYKLYLKYSIK